jgi:DNA-binding NarL/FixJ family response regulator
MTAPASDRDGSTGAASQIHAVLATHRREVQTALFHSLNTISTVTIVATGTSTAELVNYSRAFRPDMVIVETGLPGQPLSDVLIELGTLRPMPRILLIGENTELSVYEGIPTVEVFSDLDLLIATIPDEGADSP